MILATSESPCCGKPSIKFLLKRIYSLEENVGWWIPRWLLSAKQSLICKWDDLLFLSLHVARSLPSSFCSRGYMVWKKMLVEEFQDGRLMLDPLWHLNWIILTFLSNLSTCCLSSSFYQRGYMVWKMMMFEEFQDWCLVLGNLWYVNEMILAN